MVSIIVSVSVLCSSPVNEWRPTTALPSAVKEVISKLSDALWPEVRGTCDATNRCRICCRSVSRRCELATSLSEDRLPLAGDGLPAHKKVNYQRTRTPFVAERCQCDAASAEDIQH
jgi:hypothetical protein